MKIHFISIGGSVMHSMAIAMKQQGHEVSGSDDEIFEPALSRLALNGILPPEKGWFAEKITSDLDIVVLGMHARPDNPELLEAQQKNLKIVSFPEFVYQNSLNKKRIVVAGSHGKTTITSMLMHVFRECGKNFDYLVGSSVAGFDNSFKLTQDAEYMIIEGDEYLSSAINPEPKFLWYKPQLAVISGIAWDHYNVFPTFDIYVEQFRKFIQSILPDGHLVYDENDQVLKKVVKSFQHIHQYPYNYPEYQLDGEKFLVKQSDGEMTSLQLFGSHNLLNLNAAKQISLLCGISEKDFFQAIGTFKGAGKRLEMIFQQDNLQVFRDFAHAPSKVRATINGIKQQFPGKKILACVELHTYSSLNPEFLPQYAHTTDPADCCGIFINEEAVKLKGLKMLSPEEVKKAFANEQLSVFYERDKLEKFILQHISCSEIVLLMSSGNFAGLDAQKLFTATLNK